MKNKKHPKILVVDDEADILELLRYNLSKEGYDVKTVQDSRKAFESAKDFNPDLILLDIMMPHLDGVEVCRQFRESSEFDDTLIFFLTARSEEYSEVAAFNTGADDYIIKPIKPRALLKRIDVALNRKEKKGNEEDIINIKDINIERSSYTVNANGKAINLPKREFELLYFLAKNPNKVYSRDDLLTSVWGTDVYVLSRTVDVHVRKIREKIGDGYISTVKGVGYKFEV